MRGIFNLFVATKLVAVAGEPLVFILPATTTKQHGNEKSERNGGAYLEAKDVDFGRQPHATDITNHGDKLSHKLDQSKLKHTPEKAAFQSAGEAGLLDFDNPLEDIFTGNFHAKDMARRLGKQSKSKSSKHAWNDGKSTWNDGKSSKSQLSKSKSSKSKTSQSKPSKSKSSKSKSSKSKSSKSKSSAWSGHHASAGIGGWGSVSASKSAKAKGHGYEYESRSTSIDFSYQIGSYSLWSIDESPERFEPLAEITAEVTDSPVSAKPAPEIVKPRQETLLVSELANLDSTNAMKNTPDASSNSPTVVDENLRSNRMYYVAGAALFGGLVTFFASVFIKRKIKSDDTHTKLNENSSQDDTEATTPSDGTHSYNLGDVQPTTSSTDCEWSHPDSWLAFDMRA